MIFFFLGRDELTREWFLAANAGALKERLRRLELCEFVVSETFYTRPRGFTHFWDFFIRRRSATSSIRYTDAAGGLCTRLSHVSQSVQVTSGLKADHVVISGET
jgi:hypothetical protein